MDEKKALLEKQAGLLAEAVMHVGTSPSDVERPANLVDGLFAIAKALTDVSSAIRAAGNDRTYTLKED